MPSLRDKLAVLGTLFIPSSVQAIQVSPGSPCANLCLASGSDNPWSASASTTNSTEISCSDAAYADTKPGIKFKRCVDCLRTSTRHNMDETDAKWFIYNLRYTVSTCLFSKPDPPTDGIKPPCASNKACQNIQGSLFSDHLAPYQNTTWDYCSSDDGSFMGPDGGSCLQCLQQSNDQIYMANFLIALEAGCRQTPEAGTAIGLSGTVFTHNTVTITDPSEESGETKHKSTSLSTAAIAGIVVGVIVLFVIAVGLLLLYCHRAADEPIDVWEDGYYDSQPNSGNNIYAARSYGSPAKSQFQYIRNGSEKTVSVGSSGEYYDRLAKEMYERQEVYPMQPLDPNSVPRSNVGLPAHPAYIPGTMSRNNTPAIRRGRDLAAPEPTHARVRSNTPDSFAEQAYLQAAEDSARLATTTGRASRAPTATTAVAVTPAGPPYETKKRVNKIAILNLPKISVPKPGKTRKTAKAKASPPVYNTGDPGISGPIMDNSRRRFADKPIGGPVVISTSPNPPRPPTPDEEDYQYQEVPLKSGKSLLYG